MSELTPMLKQYQEIKDRHKNELLLFRLGDFYEMFGDDAREASRILTIVLTARSKGTEHEVPMCGIPHHALQNYLAKLLKAGKRVAICDQVSDPTLPGLVKREVTRIITPGTTLEDNTISEKRNNFIISLFLIKDVWGFAEADLTTGEFKLTEISDLNLLKNEIFKLNASEVILTGALFNDSRHKEFISSLNNVNVYQLNVFDRAYNILTRHFKIQNLQSFGVENMKVGIEAGGLLLSYLKDTQKTNLEHIIKIGRYNFSEYMALDEATIRNLEIFNLSSTFEYRGSLLSVMDQTLTNMGGRMLRRNLIMPLIDLGRINARLNAVGVIKNDGQLVRNLTEKLKQIFDLERLMGKIGCRRVNARDMVALKNSLLLIPEIKNLIKEKDCVLLQNFHDNLNNFTELVGLLENVFIEEPSHLILEGNMIKDGYNNELDELRQISKGGKEWLATYQAQEIERTKISSLKVKFNSVFGYYIEISKANLPDVPADYNRKQTLVNAERFTTKELSEYESKILGAEERINNIEYQIFLETIEKVFPYFSEIQKTSEIIAELDMLLSFVTIANQNNYCEPVVNNDGKLLIKNGRHPVIEKFLEERYVPNDLTMDHEKNEFILLTGPNMSGKSSFLRQNALICLMAQIGSFVPAETAEISICDRVFTRVGASDNLAQGVSTFMAEMQEAANILNNATKDSLIILDELGRGTSTYDGVSIAWSIMEYIHNKINAKTIFATHYHELTEAVEKLERGINYCVAVSEENGRVIFLHKIIKGASSESYGIEVAKLAGLPEEIIFRANDILQLLEEKSFNSSPKKSNQDVLPLKERKADKIASALKNIDVNNLTPMEALKKIVDLQGEI